MCTNLNDLYVVYATNILYKKKDIMQNVDVKLNKTDLVVKNPFQN